MLLRFYSRPAVHVPVRTWLGESAKPHKQTPARKTKPASAAKTASGPAPRSSPGFRKKVRAAEASARASPKASPYQYGRFQPLTTPSSPLLAKLRSQHAHVTAFEDLRLRPEVRAAVVAEIARYTIARGDKPVVPSPVQRAAIKTIQKDVERDVRKTYAVAAETGLGKTWAYLAPMLDQLAREPRQGVRAVVLVPTMELVNQVADTLAHVASELHLTVFRLTNDEVHTDKVAHCTNGVVVGTPARFNVSQFAHPSVRTGEWLVVDEADTLFLELWAEHTRAVVTLRPHWHRKVLVLATVPQGYATALASMFPDAVRVETPQLHRLPKNVEVVNVMAERPPFHGLKIRALAQVLYAVHRSHAEPGMEKRVIVFVNEKRELEPLATELREKYNHDVVTVGGEDGVEARAAKLAPWLAETKRLDELEGKPAGSLKVLVATDVLSRGVNFHNVRNVVLWDMPGGSADLVHRVGRTGRVGAKGTVFLIHGKGTSGQSRGLVHAKRRQIK